MAKVPIGTWSLGGLHALHHTAMHEAPTSGQQPKIAALSAANVLDGCDKETPHCRTMIPSEELPNLSNVALVPAESVPIGKVGEYTDFAGSVKPQVHSQSEPN